MFALVIALPSFLLAQKKVKVYAYQQQVVPGVRNITIDESGTTKEIPNKMSPNTFIYLEAPGSKSIEAKHVWLNGHLFDVKTEKANVPVVMYNNSIPSKKPDTLVHATSNRVWQLSPITTSESFNPSAKAKRKMKTQQLVLHTIENGRNCYYYVDHIKILDPVVLQ